jgi:hypothetical protein
MASSTSSSSNGIGVIGLLGIVFVTLKLTHVIDWSWWYVTAPFWAGFAFISVALVIYLLLVVVNAIIKKR